MNIPIINLYESKELEMNKNEDLTSNANKNDDDNIENTEHSPIQSPNINLLSPSFNINTQNENTPNIQNNGSAKISLTNNENTCSLNISSSEQEGTNKNESELQQNEDIFYQQSNNIMQQRIDYVLNGHHDDEKDVEEEIESMVSSGISNGNISNDTNPLKYKLRKYQIKIKKLERRKEYQ